MNFVNYFQNTYKFKITIYNIINKDEREKLKLNIKKGEIFYV